MKTQTLLFTALFSANLAAQIQINPFFTQEKISQIALSDNGTLIGINIQGELRNISGLQKLATGLSPNIAPAIAYQRIAAADKQGNFWLWDNGKIYRSQIPLAENAKILPLPFATIAITKQDDRYKLVRIETKGDKLEITATASLDILPDAHPMQIDFQHPAPNQGHIAVLAKPDSKTYQHGVLGDDIEALEVHYLERHTLKPLAEKLTINGLVFEANRFEHFSHGNGARLVSVMSGNGEGGRTVLIGEKEGKLTIENQSTPLPNNRWQSPFVFNQKLYAVQMPHLYGKLVEYTPKGSTLAENFIQDGLSNHAYGEYETNLTAATENFAVIPNRNYRSVYILQKNGDLTALEQNLPAEIQKTKASKEKAYLLLENGQIWIVEDK